MFKQLKNNFFQAGFGSFIWITILCSLTDFSSKIPFHYIWNLVGISVLIGLLFGIVYPFYGTIRPLKLQSMLSSVQC